MQLIYGHDHDPGERLSSTRRTLFLNCQDNNCCDRGARWVHASSLCDVQLHCEPNNGSRGLDYNLAMSYRCYVANVLLRSS
jgi:hypothetical protein